MRLTPSRPNTSHHRRRPILVRACGSTLMRSVTQQKTTQSGNAPIAMAASMYTPPFISPQTIAPTPKAKNVTRIVTW
jgi:hypothetical protein